jgi:hypothetical protein
MWRVTCGGNWFEFEHAELEVVLTVALDYDRVTEPDRYVAINREPTHAELELLRRYLNAVPPRIPCDYGYMFACEELF